MFLLSSGVINGCKISLLLGLVMMVLSIFTWKMTLPPNNLFKHGLGIGVVVSAFVNTGLDSIKYVLFMVFARSFNDQTYITAAFLGSEGLGWVVSAMEFFQFVGNEPSDGNVSTNFNFGPTTAIVISTVLYISTCAAFVWMTTVDSVKKQFSRFTETEQKEEIENQSSFPGRCSIESVSLLIVRSGEANARISASKVHTSFLCLTWGICFAGIFHFCPPFQSYSALPYGQNCFNLTSTVMETAGPIGIVFAHFTPRMKKLRFIGALLLLFLFDCCCILYLAFQSPNPPFRDSSLGFYGVILLWSMIAFLGMYLSTTVSYNLADLSESSVQAGAMTSQMSGLIAVLIPTALISFNCLKDPIQ